MFITQMWFNNTKRWVVLLLGCLALLLGGLALLPILVRADEAGDKKLFDELDVTENGLLSGTEITPEVRKYDANRDNMLTWEEFVAGRANERGGKPTPTDDDAPAPESAEQTVAKPAPVAQPAAPPVMPLKSRPGYIVGRATFANGRAIPRFKVSAVGFDGLAHVDTFSNAVPSLGDVEGNNGTYALKTTYELDRDRAVSATVVGVSAETEVNYNGEIFTIMLHPVDGKANGTDEDHFRGNSGKGVVRDFVMKISGRKPGYKGRDDTPNAFYGAPVKLDLTTGDGRTYGSELASTAPKGSVITITLVPDGPLLDGSEGEIVTRTVRITSRADYHFYLQDIPIGNYTATAQMTEPDGTARELKLSSKIISKSEDFQSSARIKMTPRFSALLGGGDGGTLSLVK